jgi:hypothetical protein
LRRYLTGVVAGAVLAAGLLGTTFAGPAWASSETCIGFGGFVDQQALLPGIPVAQFNITTATTTAGTNVVTFIGGALSAADVPPYPAGSGVTTPQSFAKAAAAGAFVGVIAKGAIVAETPTSATLDLVNAFGVPIGPDNATVSGLAKLKVTRSWVSEIYADGTNGSTTSTATGCAGLVNPAVEAVTTFAGPEMISRNCTTAVNPVAGTVSFTGPYTTNWLNTSSVVVGTTMGTVTATEVVGAEKEKLSETVTGATGAAGPLLGTTGKVKINLMPTVGDCITTTVTQVAVNRVGAAGGIFTWS